MSELRQGIDIGTSSSKGVLARPDGAIVAVADANPLRPAIMGERSKPWYAVARRCRQ